MPLPAPFPNETADYRAARDALLEAEIALRAQIEAVAALRRALPPGGAVPEDYGFTGSDGAAVRLSELFGDKSTLLLYSYMFAPGDARPCPACTSLIDGLDGHAPQIGQRVAFAAVSSAAPAQLAALQAERGWRQVRMVSAEGTDYQARYHGVHPSGGQMPMMNVFTRGGDGIRHFWGTEMLYAELDGHPRHMDLLWPLWNALDLTPEGRGDWFPAVFEDG